MPQVEVIPATADQEAILANLLELYAHDFSEFLPLQLDESGRFGYKNLPLYWTDPDRFPFLIRVDGKLAGFAFVRRGSEVSESKSVWDMAEFFIVRAYRRMGIGKKAAHEVWRKFPGHWEVRVMEANRDALPFWSRAIAVYSGEIVQPAYIEKGTRHWHVFTFHV